MFRKFLIRGLIAVVVLLFFGMSVSYGTYLILKKKRLLAVQAPTLQNGHKIEENASDISFIKQELVKCSQEVERVLDIVHSMNKQRAIAESYSRALLLLSNIGSSIMNNRTANITTDVTALVNVSAVDFNIREIVREIDDIQTVYGRKYFEQTFGQIVHHVVTQHHSSPNDGKVIRFFKRSFFKFFAYLAPSGDEVSRVLYEARIQLQSGDMKGFYNSLKSLQLQTEMMEGFLSRLETYNKVMSTIERTRKYIEQLIIEKKVDGDQTKKS